MEDTPVLGNLSGSVLDSFEKDVQHLMRQAVPRRVQAQVGQVVAETYMLERLLGEGGMGQVFEAQHSRTMGKVALKVIKASVLASPRAIQRFELEARHTASLHHPHVVTVVDYGRDGDLLYLAMELCPGRDLQTVLKEDGPLSWRETVGIAEQVLMALDAAHSSPRRLIHRDIKPANILLAPLGGPESWFAKVVDFGISTALAGDSMTVADRHLIIGTPSTMAPEQCRGQAVVPATDLYAFGCTTFGMLMGRPPYSGTAVELTQHHLHTPPPLDALQQLDAPPPAGLVEWIGWLMRKSIEQRPQGAMDALRALQSIKTTPSALIPSPSLQVAATTALPQTAAPHQVLPTYRSLFIGRNQALKALDGRVAQGSRLVTVHGAGGLGKSRLAVEWARTRAHAWPGGVYFCGLADVHDRQGLCVAIAQVLEVKLDRDEPTALLGRVLAARGRAMVVLDNVEQIVELTTDCLSMWLEQSPETLFMVTSRTRLGLTAEVVYSLGPLELPSDTAPEIESEAVALFIDRATIARPSFSPTPATRAEIAQLVAELDGLPLAIELAAARCGLLSPGAILARLDQRFRLLRSKHRDISPRQATLKATLDWSWDLLEPHERDAMTQCAVFAGSFSLEAAEAIIALDPTHDDLPWVIDLLEALTDKSLLSPAEDNRFTTFASVRAYAEAILDQTHDGTAVVKRAVAYFSAYGNPVFLDRLEQSRSALQELQAELDNVGLALRKACAYAMPEEAGLCALALGGYFLSQGPYSEGIHRVEQALKHTGASPQVRLRLHLCAGQLATAGTDLEQATAHLSKAFELSRNHDDVAHAASAHCFYGDVLQLQGRRDNARTHYQAGLELARAIDDPKRQALAHQGLGSVLAYQETWDRALEHFNVGLALARTLRHTKLEANLHIRLGQSAVTQGRRKLALDHLNNGLKLAHRIGDTRLACDARHATARALPRSEAEQIRSYYQINLELARSLGWRKREADALFGLGDLDMEQHRLDSAHARYTSVLALARTLGLERNEVTALIRIGSVQLSRGHVNEAQTRFEEALAVARSFENPITEMLALGHLGSAAMEAANADQAKQAFDDALTLSKTLSNDYVGAWILYDLGRVALLQGHTDTVEHYLTEADRFPGACDELARSGRMAWALFELRRNRPTHALCTLATDTLMHSEDPAVALMTRLEFTALMALAHASQGQHTEAERFRQQVRDHLEALTLPPYARLAVLAKQALHEG